MAKFSPAILILALLPIFTAGAYPLPTQLPTGGDLSVLDRKGAPVSTLTDGDEIRLRLTLADKASASIAVSFSLEGSSASVAACDISPGANQCTTKAIASTGWYWREDGQAGDSRVVRANGTGLAGEIQAVVQVKSRPVVMVHGFSATWESWTNYLGPQGYLAKVGLRGFAVGDGQVEGTMNTGRLDALNGQTNTIAENAAIVGRYIANVKKVAGAQQVDLVAHSMGGLIARYYIDRVMGDRDVAQLIMLGSPMAGTDCADLPASLGLYLPATLEIRPSYVQNIFNRQITHRHGVSFHAVAGVPIVEAVKSPCSAVPSDLVISLASVTAIPLSSVQVPILHTDLNTSEQAFTQSVRPLLQTPAGELKDEPDPPLAGPEPAGLQFTRVYTGHVAAGSSQDLTISIESGITVASFALYDTTRTLSVTVKGASGNVIALSPEKNGLVVVKDPETLFYLGYGFQNPKPGVWQVTLLAAPDTPATGADFALTANFQGGAKLEAQLSTVLPKVNEPVQLLANGLMLGGQALPIDVAQAVIRGPTGKVEVVSLQVKGTLAEAAWKAPAPGTYGVDIWAAGHTPDNVTVDRTVFLGLEVQPEAQGLGLPRLVFVGAICVVPLLGALALVAVLGWRHWQVSHRQPPV